MNKKKLIYLILVILLINNLYVFPIKIKASEKKVTLYNGTFTFETTDKKRTTNRYWSNIGVNISLKDNNGNPLNDKNRITIFYYETGAKNYVDTKRSTEYNYTTYIISESILRQKFNEKYRHVDEDFYEHYIATGATLYFSNIFEVYDGEDHVMRTDIMTLTDIRNVVFPGGIRWSEATKNDFPQHFDKPYPYEYKDVLLPVKVVYYLEGTEKPISKPVSLTPKSKEKWGKLGAKTYHTMASYKMCNGIRCELVESYHTSLVKPGEKHNRRTLNANKTNLKYVKDQTDATILEGGTLFVGILRPVAPPDTINSIEEELIEPCPTGVIKAESRGSEMFHVEDGIPTSEKVYVNGFSPEYLSGYKYSLVKGIKIYSVTVTKVWTLTWTTKEADGKDKKGKTIYKDVSHSKTETVSQNIPVSREFSYYLLDYFDVYGLARSTFENYALPEGKVTVDAVGYKKPIVSFTSNSLEPAHIIEPTIIEVKLTGSKDGGDTCPSPDNEDFTDDADKSVSKIKVRNDYLKFNDKILMNSSWKEEKTEKPTGIPFDLKNCGVDVMYENELLIDPEKSNGFHQSDGTVYYTRIASFNSKFNDTLDFEMEINDVVIHTPTICDAKITDLKAYNQMVQPDKSMASLILDKEFSVRVLTTGNHNDYLGYGYRDYDKYVAARNVQFPFDVYRNTEYIKAGTWITMNGIEETFYLPTWVTEGMYEIYFETPAINYEANSNYYARENYANLGIYNYVATDSIFVQVTGRLYDLQIYDISDYPLWRSVFRKQNSLNLTGNTYKVGVNDQNGIATKRNVRDTFPLVNGSHPSADKEGVLKLGYCTRFRLTTMGDMYNENDYIKITPRFYFVDQNGKNRQEVDLYYTETFNNKRQYLVKVGSERDQLNKKEYLLGNKYWQVPDNEIESNAMVEGVTSGAVRARRGVMFTFDNIKLNSVFRTYIGEPSYIPSRVIPQEVGIQKVTRSVQRWYGEYYLPSEVHVLPMNFNLKLYFQNNGYVDFNENIWLRKGYILVNFDIVSYQNDNTMGNLSYVNRENAPEGFCNMWRLEGSQLSKKDCFGAEFDFKYGDYIMYDAEKSAAIDYISSGTH